MQGTVIPICYGLVVVVTVYGGGEPLVPALVLSDIGGYELYQPESRRNPHG